MQGTPGTIIGIIITAVGLTGLGVALAQMMTHADPNGALLSLGGLGIFLVAAIVMLITVR